MPLLIDNLCQCEYVYLENCFIFKNNSMENFKNKKLEYSKENDENKKPHIRSIWVILFVCLTLGISSWWYLNTNKQDTNRIVETTKKIAPDSTMENNLVLNNEIQYNYSIDSLLKIKDYKNLYKLYPNQVLFSKQIMGYGDYETQYDTYTIFPNTENELVIFLDKSGKLIGMRATETKKWKFPFGLKMGMSIKELEALNGKEFSFQKFETDIHGQINWDKGKLGNRGISADLSHDGNISEALIGDGELKSNDPQVANYNIYLSTLFISEALPTTKKADLQKSEKEYKRELRYLYYSNGGLVGYFNDGTIAGCPRCDLLKSNVDQLYLEKTFNTYTEKNGVLQIKGGEFEYPKKNNESGSDGWAMINYKGIETVE